jgi:hypothetical protein
LDFFNQKSGTDGASQHEPTLKSASGMNFTGTNTPDLTHTKVLKAQIDGLVLPKAKWNTILSHLVVRVFKNELIDGDIPTSGIVRGEKTDSGFKFYPEANVSIQGQDANDAWRMSVDMAQRTNVDLVVELEWRDKIAAAHPGKTATLTSR